jgi:hypothetical protein
MDAANIFFSLQTPTPPPKKPVLGEVLNVVRYLMRPLRTETVEKRLLMIDDSERPPQ